jgi:hypothetical protein
MTVTAPDELRQQLRASKTAERRSALCRRLRPDLARLREPAQAAKLALRSIGRADQLLVTAGQNIERVRNDAAFAALCGASPIPASSGRTNRHRLNYGGDCDASRALHMIAVCRLRYCAHSRLRRAPHRRTQDDARDHPLPRALHRPRDLPQPPRRPGRAHPPLTSIGTSWDGSPGCLGWFRVLRGAPVYAVRQPWTMAFQIPLSHDLQG